MRRMTGRLRQRAVATACWTLAVAFGQPAVAADLSVQRSEGQVSVVNPQQLAVSLAAQAPIPVGAHIQTVNDGRIALLADGGGLLVLGMDSELFYDSSEPMDPPGRAALLRLRLNSGAMRIDARKRDLAPPADIRLTLPKLSMRIYGGEAWLQSAPDGDEVCALSGAVEIQTPQGKDRLDRPNECLRWGDDGGEHLEPGQRRGLAIDFLRTSFGDDPEAQYAAEQELNRGKRVVIDAEPTATPVTAPSTESVAAAPAAPIAITAPAAATASTVDVHAAASDAINPPAVPLPPPTVTSPAASVSTAPIHAAPPANGRWSLVLGSFSTRQQAVQAEQRWKTQHPRISEAAGVDRTYYRVLSGDYARRDAAEAALKTLRRKLEFKDAWALQLP